MLQGIQELLDRAGASWPRIDLLILGTTLATNALIERKGARTALLTTAGFRDLRAPSAWKTATRNTTFSWTSPSPWCRARGATASPSAWTRKAAC